MQGTVPHDVASLAAAQKAFGNGSSSPVRAMKIALSQAPTLQAHDSSGSITEEDYDHLKPNPYALVPGAHGGKIEAYPCTDGKPHLRFPKGKISKDAVTGDYILEAQEEDVKEILHNTIGVVSSINNKQCHQVANNDVGKRTRQHPTKEEVQGDSIHSTIHGFRPT